MSEIHDEIASEDQERARVIDALRTARAYIVFTQPKEGAPISVLSWMSPLDIVSFRGSLALVHADLGNDLAEAILTMIQGVDEIDDDGHSKKV